MDRRDSPTWIAIELSRYGETKVEDGTLEPSLRADLEVDDDFPLFVPATSYPKGNRLITIHLVEGYVFIGTGLEEVRYFALENKPYINKIISTPTGPHKIRTPSVIGDDHIQSMKDQLRQQIAADIEEGAQVRVRDGIYRSLIGRVMGVQDDHAFVKIELRSIKLIATVPRVFLEVEEASGKPSGIM